jgi:hypothetical protein
MNSIIELDVIDGGDYGPSPSAGVVPKGDGLDGEQRRERRKVDGTTPASKAWKGGHKVGGGER